MPTLSGRNRKDVQPFFELLRTERCGHLWVEVKDINASYELEVCRHCAIATIVLELCHLVAK